MKRWPHARSSEHAALCDQLDGVLDKVRALGAVAEPFLVQVSRADAPHYAEVVASPMDLATMSKKLRAGAYLTAADFEADMHLIAANAARFNGPGAPYTLMAAQVRDAALMFIAALPPQPAAAREASVDVCSPADARRGAAHDARRGSSVEADQLCAAPPAAGSPASDMQTPEQNAGLQEPAGISDVEAPEEQPDELLSALCSDAWRECTQPGPAQAAALPPLPLRPRCRFSVAPEPPAASAFTEADAKAALRAALMLMLRDAGFSSTSESALDLLADATADRLTKLGTTLGQLADARARAGLDDTPGMLRASDGDVPPELARDCITRLGVSWRRLAASAAAATGDDAEAERAHKRQC
jgi:hypothetical protein